VTASSLAEFSNYMREMRKTDVLVGVSLIIRIYLLEEFLSAQTMH
jgi:hypothetical protein